MAPAAEREGVIKFDCRFRPSEPLPRASLTDLIAWRKILFQLALIGQDPARYQGLGFGNLSCRLTAKDSVDAVEGFAISGTQTGELDEVDPRHFSWVLRCDPQRNRVEAQGPVKPSSESLTHGVVYRLDASANCVMHAHSPHIWRRAGELGLPVTDPSVPYGTPAMAAEVGRLWRETDVSQRGIFAMGGHEDGVVAFGPDVPSAGLILVRHLALAYR